MEKKFNFACCLELLLFFFQFLSLQPLASTRSLLARTWPKNCISSTEHPSSVYVNKFIEMKNTLQTWHILCWKTQSMYLMRWCLWRQQWAVAWIFFFFVIRCQVDGGKNQMKWMKFYDLPKIESNANDMNESSETKIRGNKNVFVFPHHVIWCLR